MGSLVPTIGKIWTIHCPAIQSRNVQFGSNSNQSLKIPTGTMPRSKGKAQASKGIKEDNAEASKGGNEDLQRSIQRAQLLGVKKATEKVGVPKKYLSARPLGPLEKEDGSFFSVEEWTSTVESKDPSNDLDQVLKGGVEDVYISEPASSARIDSEILKENQTLKEENSTLETSFEGLQLSQQMVRLQKEREAIDRLKLENDMLNFDNVRLKTMIEQLQVRKTRLKSLFASQEKKILELRTRLGPLLRNSFDQDNGEDERYSKKDG